jgi:Vanadium chloroperoxidase N-terminal domain
MPDPILFWNNVALEANRVSHNPGKDEQTGPTLSARALAIVHLAMYDAYAGVINTPASLPPYLPGLPPPSPGASPAAAVAAAAHETLSSLFPSQKPLFDLALSGAGDPSDPGHGFGLAVAEAIRADRAGDPDASSAGFVPSQQRGKHRPDPDNPGPGFHAPFFGAKSKGFAIRDRFELAPPPFDTDEYREALREIRGKGVAPELMGTVPSGISRRTVDETVIGIYWGYDGAAELGTPPRLYNQIIRHLAMSRSPGKPGTPNTPEQNARLFAFVNAAMADAAILAWDQKYTHDLWRPVLGVREHDRSFGPAAGFADNNFSDLCDAGWLPLGAPLTNRIGKNFTPPFPAYPSGHATFGAAAFHITRLFYGVPAGDRNPDTLFDGLDFVSDELNGVSRDNKGAVRPRHRRNFPGGLWRMIEENGRSRVYLGVHWIFDAFAVKANGTPDLARQVGGKFIGGVPLGLQIAEDTFEAGGGKAPKKSNIGPRP